MPRLFNPSSRPRKINIFLSATSIVLVLAVSPSGAAGVSSLPVVYPAVGAGTHILDHDKLLSRATLNDPGWYQPAVNWYKANIPFLDVPDKTIQAVYYYRWSVVKRNLRNTGADGYISTEFIPPVGWGNIFNSLDAADYYRLLHDYAATQFKDGHPWVAEAADPDTGQWIYDAEDHCEHYFHSTFNDLVITGLRPQIGRTLAINPLAPETWNYFCLENVPYHGHNITVL